MNIELCVPAGNNLGEGNVAQQHVVENTCKNGTFIPTSVGTGGFLFFSSVSGEAGGRPHQCQCCLRPPERLGPGAWGTDLDSDSDLFGFVSC